MRRLRHVSAKFRGSVRGIRSAICDGDEASMAAGVVKFFRVFVNHYHRQPSYDIPKDEKHGAFQRTEK